MKKVIIVGGGPAGMMAAISAKKNHPEYEVLILEKNEMLGKKLLITGKGRCNITSSLDISEFIKNIPGNGMFLYSSFKNFNNKDIITFLKNHNVETKVERGNRIFPVSDKSIDVLNAFKEEIKKLKIDVKYKSEIDDIKILDNDRFKIMLTDKKVLEVDKVILATGGKSYPLTGSTGRGYDIAKKLGHTIQKIKPSIVPLELKGDSYKILQGLSLKNVSIKIKDISKNKIIYEDFGEMIFTHFGISGPIILSASAHLIRYENIEKLLDEDKIKIYIDLKPALTIEQLNLRVLRDFEEFKNKEYKNSLYKLLPKKIIEYIIQLTDIDKNKKVNEITKKERFKLIDTIKNIEFTIKGARPIEEAIITSGGINIKEINPSTMESKIVKNLYFAGEIIDVDAYTGGFNLQIAYSTGYTAGMLNN